MASEVTIRRRPLAVFPRSSRLAVDSTPELLSAVGALPSAVRDTVSGYFLALARLITSGARDGLTGLLRADVAVDEIRRELARARRAGDRTTVLFIDFDDFKLVNKRYSHLGGNAALAAGAAVIHRHGRASDLLARFGGDEFLVLMPNTAAPTAVNVAHRIRHEIETLNIRGRSGVFHVTVSVGVAESRPRDTPSDLIARASRAILAGKDRHRNAVYVADPRTVSQVGGRKKDRKESR